MLDLVRNTEDQFSRVAAHVVNVSTHYAQKHTLCSEAKV